MRRLTITAAFLVASSAATASATEWAQKMFAVNQHDFGSVARGAKTEIEFTFRNIYLQDVRVVSVRSSCGCTSSRIKGDQRVFKTHETGVIVAHVNSDKFRGRKGATLTVTFDGPGRGEAQLQVRVFIRDDFVFRPGSAQFGSVPHGTAFLQRVQVSSPGSSSLRIVDVRSANPYLSGKVVERERNRGGTSYELQVRLDGNTPPGYFHDHLILVTNDRQYPQVPVLVEGCVRQTISISPASLLFGSLEPGEKASKQLVVQGAEPFLIKRFVAGEGFQFGNSNGQTPKRLHVIPVTFTAGAQPGKVTRAIHIETDLENTTGRLFAQATVTEPKTPPAIAAEPPASSVVLSDPQDPRPIESSAEPGVRSITLTRPNPESKPSEHPNLLRFTPLSRLTDGIAAAHSRYEKKLAEHSASGPNREAGPQKQERRFRDEKAQQRYEELLEQNGPSPSPDTQPADDDPALATQRVPAREPFSGLH